jgi:uncharacterized membrane protein YgcG
MKRGILTLALVGIAVLGLLVGAAPALAQSERILDFQSVITVHTDASMTVTENITVKATGREIKRGIIRDFPTTYRDRLGNNVTVGFAVEEVLRDGRPESYHTEQASNGVKIYIGKKDVFLKPGVYTYTIRYRADRELGFFNDFDELYWNVTGNGWTFPIDKAEAIIDLPPGAKILRYAAYTGYQGDRGQDVTAKPGEHDIVFKTTRGLAPKEGLTVAVAWPKGVVHEPSGRKKMDFLLQDNMATALGLLWLVVLLGFYLWTWHRVGRDPATGTIIPLYTPPAGFSPAGVRYLSRMGFDNKAFAAAVVDMAVKGAVLIQENDGDYTLVRGDAARQALTRGEQLIAAQLFSLDGSIKLENKNHTRIKAAIDALKKNLKTELEKIYFVTNSGYLAPGIVITLMGAGFVIFTARDHMAAGFGALWLTIWTVGCYFLAVTVYNKWKAARGSGFKLGKFLVALGVSLFALPFFAGEIAGAFMITQAVSIPATVTLGVLAFLNALFYHLLKAPTLAGRKIMDQIEGFKLYLSVAEKDRLNLLNPPEKTPELFEKYLPYALALDVENAWSEQFADVLARAGTETQPYTPIWYSGSSWDGFQTSRFAESLGSSFSSAISSSSTAPGSSSGSSGGGFSGGGGGGGGGSGW